MKNILVLAGLILAVTNVQAQELPAGLSSKCECSTTSRGWARPATEFKTITANEYGSTPMSIPAHVSVTETYMRLNIDGVVFDKCITRSDLSWAQSVFYFSDGGHARADATADKLAWSMIRLYDKSGTLYLTLSR